MIHDTRAKPQQSSCPKKQHHIVSSNNHHLPRYGVKWFNRDPFETHCSGRTNMHVSLCRITAHLPLLRLLSLFASSSSRVVDEQSPKQTLVASSLDHSHPSPPVFPRQILVSQLWPLHKQRGVLRVAREARDEKTGERDPPKHGAFHSFSGSFPSLRPGWHLCVSVITFSPF